MAAPLNGKEHATRSQLWAQPGTLMRQALVAALSVPSLFGYEECEPGEWLDEHGLSQWNKPENLALVDGSVVRANPLPALFRWIGRTWKDDKTGGRACVERLFHAEGRTAPSLMVVYSVPIAPLPENEAPPRESINVVENGFISFALERRRDTEMESRQTEFLSQLEAEIRLQAPDAERELFPIFPAAIAPEQELKFKNNLKPTRQEALIQVAAGCRRTLETIYRQKIAAKANGSSTVRCSLLLSCEAPKRLPLMNGIPGLHEVCDQCTGVLQVRPVESSSLDTSVPSYGLELEEPLRERFPVRKQFPALTGEKSRVVFLANGGVFRGSFHIGTLAALHAAKIKPDLIVGASVGTIIGAALAAVGKMSDKDAGPYIRSLACVFLNCDTRVGLTRSLKNTAKQLGIRGRSIRVSPALFRRMVREGGGNSPGYAITGAPPVLIDAISDLFLIPHAQTRRIAAQFVSGHIEEAFKTFWSAVQKETLPTLGIEDRVMGAELLEKVAEELLFPASAQIDDRETPQPYLPTALFATSTHLTRRATLLLGRDFRKEQPAPAKYGFLESCMASSAFPVVFAPRTAAGLFPGLGRTDTLLSDGGLFDNLPFFPAIEVMSDVQLDYAAANASSPSEAYEYLARRQAVPALIIAAALDPSPEKESLFPADLQSMRERASSLSKNVKIKSFAETSRLVDGQIARYIEAYKSKAHTANAGLINSVVPAAVLKVVPADSQHLNGTFAFCRSLGLEKKTMRKSIAHGCFQTLRALAVCDKDDVVLKRSMDACREDARIAAVTLRLQKSAASKEGDCPFFLIDGVALRCPFFESSDVKTDAHAIHAACIQDDLHAGAYKKDIEIAADTPK